MAALTVCRPLAGRLTVQASYAPFQPSCRVIPTRDLLRKLDRAPAESDPSKLARFLADRGILDLLLERPEKATTSMERAVRLAPYDARIANDAAVAHIALADSGRGAYQLVLALGLLNRAVTSRPNLNEARFNLALVLSRLQLISQADPAWRVVIEKEPSLEWRAEAMQELRDLRGEDLGQEWMRVKLELEKAVLEGDEARAEAIIGQFPQETRIWGQQEILARWAKAHLDRDKASAESALRVARTIGGILVGIKGERSVMDTVASIEQSPEALRDRLARGHLAYARGIGLLEALKIQEAATDLIQARFAFNGTSTPAALWSRYWLAVIDYYRGGGLDGAVDQLEALLPYSVAYSALEARIRWSLGIIGMVYIDFGKSLNEHRQALAIFDRLGERENSGAIEYLLAESFQLLGEIEEAWRHRKRAFQLLSSGGPSIRLNNLLLDASRSLAREGRFQEALYLQEEQLTVARRLSRPATLIEALLARGHLRFVLGQSDESAKDFQEARNLLGSVTDEAIRKRLWAESKIAQSQLDLATRPEEVLDPLSEVIDYFESAGLRYNAARAYLLRAKSYLGQGLSDLAERDFIRGIEAHEAAWQRLKGNSSYYTYLDQWQQLFDEAIRLRVEQRRDSEAWELLERAKGAGRLPGGLSSGTPSLKSVQRALPSGTVVVEYAVLPDRLLIWRIETSAIKLISTPVREEDLRKHVDDLLTALREGPVTDTWKSPAIELFETLIRPILAHSHRDERWILIPDKFLGSVPFAALFNKQERSFLVEMRTFAISPSSDLYARANQRGQGWSVDKASLLAVASPRWSDTGAGKILPSLPEARKEALEVSALYFRKELLVGAGASKERLLGSLRRASVLHFAGHSQASPMNPELSRLILGQGAPEQDLFARDLLERQLDHLDLVFLSACETAVGGSSRGAASGMAWAFQAAGVPAVVSTLWNVEDGISRLMSVSFHRNLKAGEDGAEALRRAQLDLLEGSGSSSHPSQWAAFEFMGELTARP